jgi:hypothetical protein
MILSTIKGEFSPFMSAKLKQRIFGLFFVLSFFLMSDLKSQVCSQCCLSSFPALTVYQSFQTGHGLGFGVEAGNWKKDTGKFSYFIGTSMVWEQNQQGNAKGQTSSQNQTFLNLYVKGQYKITKHLYAVVAPGIVNLSYFDVQAGLRYVVPISKVVGVGIEPAYSFNQKVLILNANIHFALR